MPELLRFNNIWSDLARLTKCTRQLPGIFWERFGSEYLALLSAVLANEQVRFHQVLENCVDFLEIRSEIDRYFSKFGLTRT